MQALLTGRLQAVRVVRSYWDRGERATALAHAARAAEKDAGTGVDVLTLFNSSQRAREAVTQELCVPLLRTAAAVLRGGDDTQALVALRAARALSRRWYQGTERCANAAPSPGVDIAAEERRERATECLRGFAAVRDAAKGLRGCNDAVREEADGFLRDCAAPPPAMAPLLPR